MRRQVGASNPGLGSNLGLKPQKGHMESIWGVWFKVQLGQALDGYEQERWKGIETEGKTNTNPFLKLFGGLPALCKILILRKKYML